MEKRLEWHEGGSNHLHKVLDIFRPVRLSVCACVCMCKDKDKDKDKDKNKEQGLGAGNLRDSIVGSRIRIPWTTNS